MPISTPRFPRFVLAPVLACGALAVSAFSAGCNPFVPSYCDDETALITPDGAPGGPHAVGLHDATFVARGDGKENWGNTTVELKVSAWYPADVQDEPEHCHDDIYPSIAHTSPAAACESPRPVVIASHGNRGIRWASSFLYEHLATHGYVVAAPDHTQNTFWDHDSSDAGFRAVTLRRPQDVRDTYDWLVAESLKPSSPFHGCVDPDAGYAVIGHSFGGYTALATAGWDLTFPDGPKPNLGDGRVWAVVTMASWDAGGVLARGDATLTAPVLSLAATRDETTLLEDVADLHDRIGHDNTTFGLMPEAGHITYAPLGCAVYDEGDGCGPDFLDLDVAAGVISEATLHFLEHSRGKRTAPVTEYAHDALVWNPAL